MDPETLDSPNEQFLFEKTDTGAIEDLKSAETLLRNGPSPIVADEALATSIADLLRRWIFLASLDPDLLNRIGGAETVLVARRILEHWSERPMENVEFVEPKIGDQVMYQGRLTRIEGFHEDDGTWLKGNTWICISEFRKNREGIWIPIVN